MHLILSAQAGQSEAKNPLHPTYLLTTSTGYLFNIIFLFLMLDFVVGKWTVSHLVTVTLIEGKKIYSFFLKELFMNQ